MVRGVGGHGLHDAAGESEEGPRHIVFFGRLALRLFKIAHAVFHSALEQIHQAQGAFKPVSAVALLRNRALGNGFGFLSLHPKHFGLRA